MPDRITKLRECLLAENSGGNRENKTRAEKRGTGKVQKGRKHFAKRWFTENDKDKRLGRIKAQNGGCKHGSRKEKAQERQSIKREADECIAIWEWNNGYRNRERM